MVTCCCSFDSGLACVVTSTVVDLETISKVVADLTKDDMDLSEESVQIFDAFSVPKLTYHPVRKNFTLEKQEVRQSHRLYICSHFCLFLCTVCC